MQQILHAINNLGFTTIQGLDNCVGAQAVANFSAVNPSDLSVVIEDNGVANIVILHGDDTPSSIQIRLKDSARLNLTQLFVSNSAVNISIMHSKGSVSRVVAASINNTTATYDLQLRDVNSLSEVYTLQMGADKNNNSLNLNMRHLSPDCISHSLSKCVASGQSNLQFEGLVYVAQDAQRTSAEQNCRSIELSDGSHIVAHPQLEIYADDVKCSHGATMGQINTDAILYMRQRGLSEQQARRVQIEGFITDIVDKCSIESVCGALKEVAIEKLQSM